MNGSLRVLAHTSITIALLIFTTYADADERASGPPPIAAFARLPAMSRPLLSPDGRYLLYLSEADGNRTASVLDLQQSVAKEVLRANFSDGLSMSWCRWVNQRRIVCRMEEIDRGILVKVWAARLFGVDADGANAKKLLSYSLVSKNNNELIDITPDEPDTVLLQINDTGLIGKRPSQFASAYKLNVYDGSLQLHLPESEPVRAFLSDDRGAIKIGLVLSGAREDFYWRTEAHPAWQPITGNAHGYHIQALIPGTDSAYVYGVHEGRRLLAKVDLTGKEAPTTVFAHPQVDVSDLVRVNGAQEIFGVIYDTESSGVSYLDKALAETMRNVQKLLPKTMNLPVSWSDDRKSMVIAAANDVEANAFYLYDVAENKLTLLGRTYPELEPDSLPRMYAIKYPAADGTEIPGYLTISQAAAGKKSPLIVLPHGGPRAHDRWMFNFVRLFLASRGYAVLQMNFRGSDGRGDKWLQAARQDWGGLTYSDIVDGARWAVAKGIADPQRMCIVGWSFGGYAALVGATRNSDLFKCSVSIAGVSDLRDQQRSIKRKVNEDVAVNMLGDNRDKLLANSPARFARDVKIPILLVHGTFDTTASYYQSKEMAHALKRADKPHRFVTLDNADHNLSRMSDRVTLLTELERFLQENIGAGTSQADSPTN